MNAVAFDIEKRPSSAKEMLALFPNETALTPYDNRTVSIGQPPLEENTTPLPTGTVSPQGESKTPSQRPHRILRWTASIVGVILLLTTSVYGLGYWRPGNDEVRITKHDTVTIDEEVGIDAQTESYNPNTLDTLDNISNSSVLANDTSQKVDTSVVSPTIVVDKTKANAALIEGVENGNIGKVKKALAEGADPDTMKDGHAVLMIACYNGHSEIIKALIKAKANPNIKDSSNQTPLWLVQHINVPELTRVLLVAGADPNHQSFVSVLDRAAMFGRTEHVKLLLAGGAHVNSKSGNGYTPLMYAVRGLFDGGHIEVVRILLDAGADPNARADNGTTALKLALEGSTIYMVNLLIQYGAIEY